MLVLTRKNDQAVVIGGSDDFRSFVKITVLDIMDGRVRLGFEANKGVPVHREEVRERINAGRAREPPVCYVGPTVSRGAVVNARLLSGAGKGRSLQHFEEQA